MKGRVELTIFCVILLEKMCFFCGKTSVFLVFVVQLGDKISFIQSIFKECQVSSLFFPSQGSGFMLGVGHGSRRHTCAPNFIHVRKTRWWFFFQIFVRLKPVAEKEMYQLMKAFLLKPKDRQQLLQQLTPDCYLKGYWDKIEKT